MLDFDLALPGFLRGPRYRLLNKASGGVMSATRRTLLDVSLKEMANGEAECQLRSECLNVNTFILVPWTWHWFRRRYERPPPADLMRRK